MKKTLCISLVIVMLLGMIFASSAAFAGGKKEEPAPAAPAEEKAEGPERGGVLKLILPSSSGAFGYAPSMTGRGHTEAMPAYESLLAFDEENHHIPNLATEWEFSSDYLALTLKLRQGVKFHDGTDFNAEAAKWNLDKRLEEGVFIVGLESTDVIDEYTIRLNFSEYNNTCLIDLTYYAGSQMSPTAGEKQGKEGSLTHPVGTGPFKFVSYDPDIALKYERFDDYWQEGLPYLDGIEYLYIKDPVTAIASFKAGEGNSLKVTTAKDALDLMNAGYNVIYAGAGMKMLTPDSANPDSPFADIRVRQALEHAVDKQAIVDALGFGFWEVATQISEPSHFGYNPALEKVARNYDPAKAKALLAEAGYPDGFKTTITGQAPGDSDEIVVIQKFLADVGIDAKVALLPRAQAMERERSGWEGIYLGAVGRKRNFMFNFLSAKTTHNASLARPSADWEDLLMDMITAGDHESHVKATQKCHQVMYDNSMLVTIHNRPWYHAHYPGVHTTHMVYHFDLWYPARAWIEH